MSSNQDTNQQPKNVVEEREKPNPQQPNVDEKKPAKPSCLRKFFKSYLFYFLFASGTAVTSYLVWKRFQNKH